VVNRGMRNHGSGNHVSRVGNQVSGHVSPRGVPCHRLGTPVIQPEGDARKGVFFAKTVAS